MKPILKTALLSAGMFVSMGVISHASADTKTLTDGTNNTDVAINGTLGADNTDPTASIPDGSDSWLNVTVDTATIFYNTQTNKDIVSPTYTVTNNSGRPVTVGVNSFAQKENENIPITAIGSLAVNFKRNATKNDTAGATATTALITGGAVAPKVSPANTMSLANKNGQMTSTDTTGAYGNTATFTYSGQVTATLSAMIQPTFTMNLLFTPVSWPN